MPLKDGCFVVFCVFCAFMALFTLYAAVVALPKAWRRLDRGSRIASPLLLLAMIAITAASVSAVQAGLHQQGGLLAFFAATIFWAFGLCEWELPRALVADPPARVRRRLHDGIGGAAFALAGIGQFVRPAGLSLLLLAAGCSLVIVSLIQRTRARAVPKT